MWYMATPDRINAYPWQTGFAFSDNGVNWIKDENNPVLSIGDPGEWDEDWAVSYDIFKINDCTYNMLYIGSDLEEYYLGLATWDLCTPVESDFPKILSSFTLHQNYPNPFNPSTTIDFTLPKTEYVTLKVYNILGKEVTTLVSKKLNQGNHTYKLEGKNLVSGVYYYVIKAGEFQDVKKMILIK